MKKQTYSYIPFLFAAVIAILYHVKIQPMAGDDIFFSQAVEGTKLWTYLGKRYMTWTSRVVIEALLVIIVKYPLLWKVLDILVFATFPMLLANIFGGGKIMNWCVTGAILLYPFHDMGTAGWITTTVNYFWPLWGMFFVGMIIKKMLTHQKILFAEAVFSIPICLIASSHEQVAVVLFVVFLLFGFYLWKNRADKCNYMENQSRYILAGLIVVNVVSLISILLCPGNAGRNAVSIADLPVFETYHFGDKLYLGLLSIERVFIANADAVFVVVTLILAALVYIKTDDYKKTVISGIPVLILLGQTVVRTAYPGLSGLFVIPEQVTEWSYTSLSVWLPIVYLVLTVGAILYAIYQLLGESLLEYIYSLILLGCGFGTGMILGFMATIYVSGERVYITLYFALLFVTLFCIYKMREKIAKKMRTTGGKLFVTMLALLCLVNIGFVALSV